MERALRDKKAILFFSLPAVIWFLAIVVIPVALSVGYSLLQWDGLTTPKFLGIQNYLVLLQDKQFLRSALNSLTLAAASVFIQLPISMLLAQVLASGVRHEKLFLNLLFIPVVISSTVIGQLWKKIYHPNYGLLNALLKIVGLENLTSNWLGDPASALIACLIPMIWQYIGYHMLLYYSSTKGISPDVFDAARVDGASKWQISTRIVLPMILPMIQASTIFAVVGSLKSFDMIYILTNGGPNHASEVPALTMYQKIFSSNQYGYASAISIVIIVECLLLTVLVQWIFKRLEKRWGSA